jgi:hypothetical protein
MRDINEEKGQKEPNKEKIDALMKKMNDLTKENT